MLTYEKLLNADFSALSQAVSKWRHLPQKFRTASTKFVNTVEKGLQGSDWEGEAASAAIEKFKYVERQIDYAADEAEDVHKLLDDACEVFTQSQSKLRTLTKDIEEDKYLAIRPDGEVYLSPPKDTPSEDLGMLNKSYRETIQAYKTSIQGHIDRAQEADELLAWVLSQDHNGRKKGFDANTYNSIADAKDGRKRVEEDLKELEKLTGEKSELALADADDSLDPATLKRINSIFSRHEGDPYFAEKFATRTGAAGTLDLWSKIADRRQFGDAQTKESAKIQKSLSYTLATASHSDSEGMKRWKADMVSLGDKPVITTSKYSSSDDGPRGFQVMSSLMRYGEYDDKFLNSYGKELLEFEQKSKEAPADLWKRDVFLNFGSGSDQGFDPMAGYMEALGHNPEAAKDLLYAKDWAAEGKTDSDLKYLMSGREWPDGNPSADNKAGFGYGELGHALEAATLGSPYDAAGHELHRDARTANIMEQMATTVASDIDYVENKTGIGNSLARIGAGYADDLNWATINEGGRGSSIHRDDLYRPNGDAGHADLDPTVARNFLYNVGQHEGSYEILSSAQQAFTFGALEAHADDANSAEKVLNNGAYIHGVLDEARISQVDKASNDATDKMNEELAKSAEWKKFGISQGLGLATGVAVLPLGGPTASAAAAFVVPTIVEGVSGAVETQWGMEIDEETKKREADLTNKNRMTADEFSELGHLRATNPALLHLKNNPDQDFTEGALNAYDRGASVADRTDGGRR
ncbi:DUF6571 family protein [Streptomyces atriruber]|uniref:DUF6571 family protein n=1 Tax=Streptomyces atriruber TaxID=545121 RepID=UPI000AF6D2F5|nr:DUF6571 family protein [Streptomyces atriruber]